MADLPIIILLILVILTIRSITTLLHELGHGIPALFFTREKVTLYIGSYGNPDKSLHLKFGRLELYFTYNLFLWGKGLCTHQSHIATYKSIIITLCGPFASICLAGLFLYFTFGEHTDNRIQFLSAMFIISALLDLFSNIVPSGTAIRLYDGTIAYNDGDILLHLFQIKSIDNKYEEGLKYYQQKKFDKAAKIFMEVLRSGERSNVVYEAAISANIKNHNHAAALEINKEYEKCGILNDNTYTNIGIFYAWTGDYNAALSAYKKALKLNPNNATTYNNRGYTLNLMEMYSEAIDDFNKAIELSPRYPYPYNNRGLAKIRLNNETEGLKDIELSLQIDSDNAYAHRNLGIYYFEQEDFKNALQAFEKSWEIDKDTHLLEGYLKKVRSKV